MSQDYLRRQASSFRRSSVTSPVVIRRKETETENDRSSSYVSSQGHVSTLSQIYLPGGNEYYPQERVPPTGPEAQRQYIVTTVEDDQDGSGEQRRISIITSVYQKKDEEESEKLDKKTRRILFSTEPILGGILLFPFIVLFWQAGWNLSLAFLSYLNQYKSHQNQTHFEDDEEEIYKWQVLIYPYLVVQFILLFFYLLQDKTYNFLKNRLPILKTVLLKCHIFFLATMYIVQWITLWTIWDQFITHEWYFELTLSLTALFALMVVIGHLSDLVCAPFLFGYDSIEYCIHFGCPLLTKEMKQWKINLINYVLYEIVISNLSVVTWRGFYGFMDLYIFPSDANFSFGLCLIVGYLLYFPLMYFQTYLEELNMKYEFWTFVSINFPQFYRNIRHLLAFLSCVFVWRGYWLCYDTHIIIFKDHNHTYLLCYLLSFLILSILQTASSINGPLSHINEKNNFFPLYPHCYVSIVQRKFHRYFSSNSQTEQNNYEL